MTTQSIGGGLRAGLLQRLFDKVDQDKNQSIVASELAGVMSGDDTATRAAAIVARNDTDGDGQLTAAELSAGKLAPETLAGLLSAQEYAAADRKDRQADDRKAVDDFFAHADSDGDGNLSRDEFDAERTLRMAQSLDAGETAPQHMFVALRSATDGDVITKNEIAVARRLSDVVKPISPDDPDLDPEIAARLAALPHPLPPTEGATPAPAPVDTATAMGDAVRGAALTQTLIARLIRQLEMAVPAAPTADMTA